MLETPAPTAGPTPAAQNNPAISMITGSSFPSGQNHEVKTADFFQAQGRATLKLVTAHRGHIDITRSREHGIDYAPIAGHLPRLHGIEMSGADGFLQILIGDAPVSIQLRS
jgi:hypothetical protein